MYIIDPTDKITSVLASSEDSSYPASFVQDNFRTNPWKAGSAVESTLTLEVSAGAAGIGLSHMNSAQVTVLVEAPGPVTVHNQAYNIDPKNPNLFVNFGTQATTLTITLTFSDPGSVAPYCGVIRCSSLHTFNNPKYGMQEGLKEYAVSNKLNSGALDYELFQMCRTFSGQFRAARDSDFRTFLYTIVKPQGRNPMFWVITDTNNQDWVVFAELEAMPKGSHNHPQASLMPFTIVEAI